MLSLPEWPILLLLLGGAGLAGFIDALVGGGGLILIPLLLLSFPAAAPAVALGTNKVVALFGTAAAAIIMSRRQVMPWKMVGPAALLAAGAASAGAVVAGSLSLKVARPLILVLLLVVGIVVAARPQFGSDGGEKRPAAAKLARRWLGATVCLITVAFYDGFFGPGTGMFLIFLLSWVLSENFLASAALAKVANTASNLGALLVFAVTGQVYWLLGLALIPANILGGLLGARLLLRRGSGLVRIALLALVVVLVIKLGADHWAGAGN